MIIRKANDRDLEQLRSLYRELDEDAVRFQPEHFIMSNRSDEYLLNLIHGVNTDILVAEQGNDMIGFSLLFRQYSKNISCLKPQSNVYIGDLVVTKKFRSQGVGTKLMEASKEYGKVHGAEFIRTQVFPQNEDAIRFYERNGFTEMMKTIECQL